MKRQLALATALLLTVALTACTPAPQSPDSGVTPPNSGVMPPPQSQNSGPEPAPLPVSGLTAENYPRVDGSTATLPLMAQVYSTVCGVSLTDAETMVTASKTGPAWKKLADGQTDLLLVYEPSEGIKQELSAGNVLLSATPIGRDALVFMANTANKVDSLTWQQLVDIYTGKVTDWSAVGGDKGPIAAFQRDADSGSQTLFQKLLMGNTKPMNAPTELRPGMMGSLVDGISEYDGSGGAIGYSVYFYINEMYAKPNLKLLAVGGVQPNNQTIGDASYPLTNEFYLVIRADEPAGSPARLLHDWLLTDAGRQTLTDAGYVGISSEKIPAAIPFGTGTMPDPTVKKYFDYLQQVPAELLFGDDDPTFSDIEMASFAISLMYRERFPDFDYAIGATRAEMDAMVQKHFGKAVKSYENRMTTVLPSGNITATGWSPTPSYYLLKELYTPPYGETRAVLYRVPNPFGEVDHEKYLQDILMGNFDNSYDYGKNDDQLVGAFESLTEVEITFVEKTDADGNPYRQLVSAKNLGEATAPYKLYKTL